MAPPDEQRRVRALARLADSEDGKVLVEWLRSFHARDFVRFRSARNMEEKAYADGGSDRAAEILNQIVGAGEALANQLKERDHGNR